MNAPNNVVEEKSSGMQMPEPLARKLAELSKGLPADFRYKRMAMAPAKVEFDALPDGSRADISTITTDDPDHEDEVVIPAGGDFSVFQKNPSVFFAHDYQEPPVGVCLWTKTRDHDILAKTKYFKRPEAWTTDWLPDAILSMMQEGACRGKSMGFLPLHRRTATSDELRARPDWGRKVITDKWLKLEYSVAPIPMNSNAVALAVAKCVKDAALKAFILGKIGPSVSAGDRSTTPDKRTFTTAQIEQMQRELKIAALKSATLDILRPEEYVAKQRAELIASVPGMVRDAMEEAYNRAKGRA